MHWSTSTASRAFCVTIEGGEARYRQVGAAHAAGLEARAGAGRSASAAGAAVPCDGDGVASTPEAVLAGLERAYRRREAAPWVPLGAVVLLWVAATLALGARLPAVAVALVVLGTVALVAAAWAIAYRIDRAFGTADLVYHLDGAASARFARMQAGLKQLAQAKRVWHVPSEGRGAGERRKHGARLFLRRYVIRPSLGVPPRVRTNLRVPTVYGEHRKYFFFPDRVLVFEERAVRTLAYAALGPRRGETLCMEDEDVPFDSRVVESAWLHATPDGAPDTRYANNRRYPVVLYGELEFAGPAGVREVFLFSQPGAADAFVEAVDAAAWDVDDEEPDEADDPGEGEAPDARAEEGAGDAEPEPDALYDDALRAVVRAGHATLELLVAEFRIDYGRAARLLAEMERDGYVGPAYRHQPRAVNRSAVRYVALRFGADEGERQRERAREQRRSRRRRRAAAGHRPPHEVLGVREGASREEIAEAYRDLAQLYHPDKVAALAPEFQDLAELRMKEINAAYRALTRRDV